MWYFLQTFKINFKKSKMVIFFLIWAFLGTLGELQASQYEASYERFFRLNTPINRSESGDWVGFSFNTDKAIKNWDSFASGDLRFYFQDGIALNYSIQEAYLTYQAAEFQIKIGRQILDWNTNEKYWSLGFLNGLQSFSLLSTEEEGVTAVVITKKWGDLELDLLGSYLFTPQINPSIDFKNGLVKSRSEWMRLPPKKTIISGVEVPISYSIADYQIEKIVFNKSLGANLRYFWKDGGVSAFAIYKPENKLRVNASAYYDNLGTNKVIVTADPTVNHHAYYGIQAFYRFGDLKAKGGISYVDPNAKLGKDFLLDITNARKTFKSDYFNINPRYDKEAYTHLSLTYDKNENYKLSFNYIHLLSTNIRGNDDFFSDTVKWKKTFGAGIQYFFNDTFQCSLDLKFDVIRKDNILKSEAKYNFNQQLNLALGLEVLKAPDNNSYWSYYRTNDTLYTALGYIF